MKKLIFVRHALSDFTHQDDFTRPLREEGVKESYKIVDVLSKFDIDAIYSSPYIRSTDTIKPYAEYSKLDVTIIDDLKEVDRGQYFEDMSEFKAVKKRMWDDRNYHCKNGESLNNVKARNINVINKLLQTTHNTIVISTQGTALAMILEHFLGKFTQDDFSKYEFIMPYIITLDIENNKLVNIDEIYPYPVLYK